MNFKKKEQEHQTNKQMYKNDLKLFYINLKYDTSLMIVKPLKSIKQNVANIKFKICKIINCKTSYHRS